MDLEGGSVDELKHAPVRHEAVAVGTELADIESRGVLGKHGTGKEARTESVDRAEENEK